MRFLWLMAWPLTSAFAAEPITIDSIPSSAEADWSALYKASFSGMEEVTHEDTKVDNPTLDELLLSTASLPVRFIFGEPNTRWSGEEAPQIYAEDRRAATKVELAGCKLKIKTGPIQVATYESSSGNLTLSQDSLPPRTQLHLPQNGDAYISASAELSVEVVRKTKNTCSKQLAGRLVPVGRFSFEATQIRVVGPDDESSFDGVTDTAGIMQDIYLMWPAGAETPVLFDSKGPHPQIETGRRRFHVVSGDLYLDVEPKLEHVGELVWDVQRAANLEALYGPRVR